MASESVEKPVQTKVMMTKRAGKRQAVTKTIVKVQASFDTLTDQDCSFYIEKLTDLQRNLGQLDESISCAMLEDGSWNQDRYISECDTNDEYTDDIARCILTLKSKATTQARSAEPAHNTVSSVSHKVTLPHIELPTFDGKPESYTKFIVSFENLISKYNLSPFEKFSYLSKQLTGVAKKLIESLSLNDLNYESAKKLLNDAFCNKLDQQFSVISNLCALKLDHNAKDAYTWIGEARLLDEQVQSLQITAEVFTQYFMWQGLNDKFRRHLTAVTTKTRPSWPLMKDALFEANLRFVEEQRLSPVVTLESVAAAAAVKSKVNYRGTCALCSKDLSVDANHPLSQCPRYPDVESKVAKLKLVGGCLKCGYTNHNAKSCSFKFKRSCFKCNGPHMTFLCYRDSKNTVTAKLPHLDKSNVKSTATNVVATVSMATESFNDVILPTATVYFPGAQDVPVRIFKDIGSQSSFVKGTPKTIPNCTVLRKVRVNVKGINSIESYNAPVVRFPVEIPGQGIQQISAICLPTLNTEVSAKGLADLSVMFKERGLVLADKNLNSDHINDVSILLGSDQCHLFPLTQFNYKVGDDNYSVIYETPAGLMLSGSVSNYVHNMPALPSHLCRKT